jgi:hypothetical protein
LKPASKKAGKISKTGLPEIGYRIGVLERYPELRAVFLKHLATYGNLTAAAAHVRLSQEQIDLTCRNKPWFQAEVEAAKAQHQALIERTIHQRAIDGWDEPKFNQTGIVGHVRRYSDTLLIAYARRHIPEYREGDTTLSKVEGEVVHKHKVDVGQLTDEQRNALRLLLGEQPQPEVMKQITVSEPSKNGKHHTNGTNGHVDS